MARRYWPLRRGRRSRRCRVRCWAVKHIREQFAGSKDIMSFINPQIAVLLLVTIALLIAALVLVTLAVHRGD